MKRTCFLLLFLAANAQAFSSARPTSVPTQTPHELASFTSINQQGAAALSEIQRRQWERRKIFTLQMNLVDSIQVMARQTAKFSLSGDVLKIQSTAGDSSLFNPPSLEDSSGDIARQNFNAPIFFSKQRIEKDGTVQIAFGVRYRHDGSMAKDQPNKITIAALKNEIFSLPDAMPFSESPNLSQAVELELVQFIVLSWNPGSPRTLKLEGISDPSASESFSTTYSAL